jgi:putative two-component system response regulator
MEWEKLGKITILIADDDAFNRQLIISLLSKIPSIKYIEAENGIEALDFLSKEKIDIILLDLHMPKLDGIETIKEIKRTPAHSLIPIIIISTDELIMRQIRSLGADDFVSKPFKLSELQAKIYKHVEAVYYKKRLKNSKGEGEIKKSRDEEQVFNLKAVEKSQKEMFKGIAYILSLRDKNVVITAKLVRAFAELLNYDKEDIERLYLSTLVYNMGALASKDFITSHMDMDNTQDTMYIFNGYQIIKNSIETPFLKMLQTVLIQHKENYDGTGVPQELQGDKISPYAQIVHLIETFNILSSQQNSPQSIYNFLSKQSGKMFNPKILHIFLEYFEYFIELRKKYAKEK